MLPHAKLHKIHGQSGILYDLLGAGAHPHWGFFTPAVFFAKLHHLVRLLRINNDFYMLRQSWGVTLATEYIAAHRPQGLKLFVLTSSAASHLLWRAALTGLRRRCPQDCEDMMDHRERRARLTRRCTRRSSCGSTGGISSASRCDSRKRPGQ